MPSQNRPHALPNRPRALPNRPHALPNRPRALPNRPRALPNRARALPNRPHALPNRPRALPNRPHALFRRLDARFRRLDARFRWLRPPPRPINFAAPQACTSDSPSTCPLPLAPCPAAPPRRGPLSSRCPPSPTLCPPEMPTRSPRACSTLVEWLWVPSSPPSSHSRSAHLPWRASYVPTTAPMPCATPRTRSPWPRPLTR